jgi:hypothetical protein
VIVLRDIRSWLGWGMKLSRLRSAAKKESKMGFDPKIAAWKAAKAFAFALAVQLMDTVAQLLTDQEKLTEILARADVPTTVTVAAVAIIAAAGKWVHNWWKIARPGLGLVILPLLLLAGQGAYAQGADPPEAIAGDGVVIETETWTLITVTRGERGEYVGGRITATLPLPEQLRLFARADVTGTQDGGAIDFASPETFRSVEGYVGIGRAFGPVVPSLVYGLTWSIEGADGPANPRQHSALGVVRVPLPGGGYAYAGGGYHEPVGGWAAVASVSYAVGPTRYLVDYALPFARAADGGELPWVVRTGISIPIKRWTLR